MRRHTNDACVGKFFVLERIRAAPLTTNSKCSGLVLDSWDFKSKRIRPLRSDRVPKEFPNVTAEKKIYALVL
jgi:hypothetical protein